MKYLLGLFLSILFLACAQVVAPTGGERDLIPPQILQTKPENKSLNFNSNIIEIVFDEYIKLEKLKEQLIVSPPLKYNIETTIKGKSLELEIRDTLKENTTYVMNFGDAIVDITENNAISNFQYVFSTGSEIDSLSISGSIINAFNLKASESMLVMLYSEIENDSIPITNIPNYIAKTNKNGEYEITNIKAGEYKIFALKDANRNFLFDRPDEEIAFKKNAIKINAHTDSLKLFSFQEDRQAQFIESQKESETQLILDFKNSLKAFQFKILDSATLLHSYLNVNQDSAFFWWEEMPKSKIKLIITDDTLFADTINVIIDSIAANNQLKLERPIRKRQNYYSPMVLLFNRPIAKWDTNKIRVYNKDSTEVKYKLVRNKEKTKKSYSLSFAFEEDSSYQLKILPGAFEDIYQKTTDTLSYNFLFNKASDFGTLEVSINSEYENQKIIQLYKDKNKLVEEKVIVKDGDSNLERVKFEHLKNGTYNLKLIIDGNPNKKWDTGDYLMGVQAEKTIIFNENIRIRPNWDKEIEWIIK